MVCIIGWVGSVYRWGVVKPINLIRMQRKEKETEIRLTGKIEGKKSRLGGGVTGECTGYSSERGISTSSFLG